MKVAVIGGTGYVGLTTAVCLASKGHVVFCVGRNEEKIEKICTGLPIIYEENLERMLKDVLENNKLIPTTDLRNAIQNSDVSFICVGTPSKADGSIDLGQVKNATREIGRALIEQRDYHVVTVKSTVLPGTTEETVIPILEKASKKRAGVDFGVCMNPEFLREGHAIKDFLFPKDLGIVVGELNEESGDVLFQVYKDFDAEILRTSIRTAEMIKYARNAYLAKDISFANEIANICERLEVDYEEVKKGMKLDSRIGKRRFLNAGCGFGGSCFPKDVKALVAKAKEKDYIPKLLEATLEVNGNQPYRMLELARKALDIKGKRIAILGLAFKPGTDDLREAPSVKVIYSLLKEGAHPVVYDPRAMDNARKIFGSNIIYAKTPEEALSMSEACLIITEWPEFINPRLYVCMRGKVIIDGRRVLDSNALSSECTYYAIGYPNR